MDQTQDLSLTSLHEYTQIYGDIPSYVKEASQAETLSPDGLSDISYADIVNRRFPIHTKAACYISSLYFLENRESIAPVTREHISARLAKAAAQHGISEDIAELTMRSEQLKKEASYYLPEDCMLPEEARYPLRNSAEVKEAADYLLKYRAWFPLETRIGMASRVLDKAASFGVEFEPDVDLALQKQAGRGLYNPDEVCNQIIYRKTLITDPGVKEALTKLASTISSMPELALDSSATQGIALTLDEIDRTWEIKYGKAVRPPEDFMFGSTFKAASAEVSSRFGTATGSMYYKSQLSDMDRESITELFGEKCASSVASIVGIDTEKLANHISSLPYMDALTFDWHMAQSGIDPVSVMPVAVGIAQEQRQKLAEEYSAMTR